jgi:zinc protease
VRFLKKVLLFSVFFCISECCCVNCGTAKPDVTANSHHEYCAPLNIKAKTLSNGLKVIVVNMGVSDVIAVGIGYLVGSGDDPRNVVGVSHFLEHMMFHGTQNLDGEKLKEILFIYNKYSNAFTSFDITFYTHLCNKSFVDINLKIEADRMRNLKLEELAVIKEKEVIIEERKMRMESDPRINHVEEAISKTIHLFSNYSYPIIGYLDQIQSCNRNVIQEHYDKFYVPNNAFVLFAGDVTMQEAVAKVEKYFGAIPKGRDVERTRVIDPINTGLSFCVNHESEQISTHSLNIAYKVDRALFCDVKKLMILEIAVGILAGGESSVLYKNIVDIKKLSYDIAGHLDVRAFDKGILNISTTFRENKKADVIEAEVISLINKFANELLTIELFEREKQKVLDQIEMLEDNPQGMMNLILGYIVNGYNLDEIKDIKSIVKQITFEEVKNAVEILVNSRNRLMKVYSHPKEVNA